MKVDFSLTDSQKLILQILYETKEIKATSLEKIFELFRDGECSISRISELVTQIESFNRMVLGTFTLGLSELERDIHGLEFIGLIELISDTSLPILIQVQDKSDLRNYRARLTEEGQRIAQRISENRRLIFRPSPQKRTSVFVACAFGRDDIDMLYEKHLEPACTKLGYNAVRVDITEPPDTITEAIMRGIVEAECVLADLTYARPSIYFEVGFSHGLGIPILLTCRRDHYRSQIDNTRVHFDLEQFKISFWSREKRGRFHWSEQMKPDERLEKLIKSRSA